MTESPINFKRRYTDTLTPHPHDANEPCPGGCEDVKVIEQAICELRREITELEHRVKEIQNRSKGVEEQLSEGHVRMGRIEATLSSTGDKLDANTKETSEILSIVHDGRGFFRVTKRLGEVIKWFFGLGAAALGFYYALKDWKIH